MEKDKFISFIEFEKRYSIHTVVAYKTDLDQFYSYLLSGYNTSAISEVNHLMIRSWTVELIEKKVSARSVNRKLSTLKSYFRYLIREGIIDHNPMGKITSPKSSKRLPLFIEKEKMDTMLDFGDFGENFSSHRDRMILELFYISGMRLSELINIKEADIDFHHSTIKVLGKRNKERLIPFSDKFGELLKRYLREKALFYIQTQNLTSHSDEKSLNLTYLQKEFLFLTNQGKQLYPKMVFRIVHSHLGQISTQAKRSPHILRHTFATQMLNNGADLNAVKELLGHASLSATQVYTHNTIEKLKRIYNQAHPKA